MTAYRGTPVSDGVAVGELYLPDVPSGAGAAAATVTSRADVRAAFAAVAAARDALAGRLRADGRGQRGGHRRDRRADRGRSGAVGPAIAALADGATASAAISAAAEAQAAILESLPDPDLAQRAGDVRQVAGAVAALLAGAAAPPAPDGPFILVRREVDPADLIRLADGANLAGAVSVGGGASSHAAIIARGLGLPMLAAADPAVLAGPSGRAAVLDAGRGSS